VGRHAGETCSVERARVLRTASEKLSTHVSIAIPLCNSRLNLTSGSRWVWNWAQSVRLKSGRSVGCWNDERYIVSISTGRWSELSAKHEDRFADEGITLVVIVSKISGVAEGLYALVVRVSVSKIGKVFPSA
jgi:hypothetical protein